MTAEDNKLNEDTHNSVKPTDSYSGTEPKIPEANSTKIEPPKIEKPSTKVQIEQMMHNIKPYTEKAWSATTDAFSFMKEKTPDFIEAAKKGLQEAKETVQDVYDKYKQYRAKKSSNAVSEDSADKKNTNDSNKPNV